MASLGNIRQVGEGNTETSPSCKKQPSRKTYYAFTLYNYDKVGFEDSLIVYLKTISKRFIYGKEICPTSQRKHLQGFIHLKKPMRITEIKIAGNPHLESCIAGEESNIKYCSKDGNIVSYGFPKPIDIISELYPWQKDIEDIILSTPNNRKVYWFWDSVGNIGKSAFVKYCIVKHKVLFCDGGKKSDIINLLFNNNMDECNCIIWDIPRSTGGKVSYSAIESIKNGFICNTKYETGVKVFNSPHVIVFANYPPENLDELSKDRWDITELCWNVKKNVVEGI